VAQLAQPNRRRSGLVAVASVVPCSADVDSTTATPSCCEGFLGVFLKTATLNYTPPSSKPAFGPRFPIILSCAGSYVLKKDAGNSGALSRTKRISCLRATTSRKAWKHVVFDVGIVRIGAGAVLCRVHKVADELVVTSMPYALAKAVGGGAALGVSGIRISFGKWSNVNELGQGAMP
jgi:hypothetical protein